MTTLIRISMAALVLACAACNTVEGVGQDLSAAGDAVSEEAREAEAGL